VVSFFCKNNFKHCFILKKTCIIIVGPTAVGKTNLAILLAQHFNTQIISADSRQCFTPLNIGVAKPTLQQLNAVPHHFINSHLITDVVNAAMYEQYALNKINEIFSINDYAVMVGGTGLYVNAFCNGIDELPAIDVTIRKNIIEQYNLQGLSWLQQQVQQVDELYFKKGETKNPQRLMRALEVKLSTGQSILHFQTQQKKIRNFNVIKIGLHLAKKNLIKNINDRVEDMMAQGLLKEVESLIDFQNQNALQTVGYTELFDYLNEKTTLTQAVELIKIHTRQYAKRQLTWFKKDASTQWVSPHISVAELLKVFSENNC
jgi:tRNA dimethylallyltransferase